MEYTFTHAEVQYIMRICSIPNLYTFKYWGPELIEEWLLNRIKEINEEHPAMLSEAGRKKVITVISHFIKNGITFAEDSHKDFWTENSVKIEKLDLHPKCNKDCYLVFHMTGGYHRTDCNSSTPTS